MKKLFAIFFLLSAFGANAQLRNSWFGQYGRFGPPLYQHKSDLPTTANPPIIVIVADSVGSTTVPNGMYSIDSLGIHPFSPGSGGGGGGMAIGATISGANPFEILYADGSNNLAQNANLFFDPTNIAIGLGNSAPISDMEIQHNTSGVKTSGLTLSAFGGSGPVANYLDFVNNRGTRSSPTGPSTGDTSLAVRAYKWNGSIEQKVASMVVKITGTPSTTNLPSEWDWWTNTAATPSVFTQGMSLDNTQVLNANKLIVGSGVSPSVDGNAQFSIAEILQTEPNLPYGATLMLNDKSGASANNGSRLMWGVEISSNLWTGGAVLKGYKTNSTANDYSAGLILQTRLNGNSQAEAIRWNELQHTLVGGISADSAAWLHIQAANSTTAQIFFKASAVDPTSPKNGDMWYDSLSNALYFRNANTNTNLLSGGGATPNIATVLNSANQSANATWTLGGNTLKFSGVSHDTTNTAGLTAMANDSTFRLLPWAALGVKIAQYLPTSNIYFANGLTGAGGDSAYLGGTLNQTTTIAKAGFNFSIIGNGQVDIGGTSAPAGTNLTIEGNTSYVPSSGNHGMLLNTNLGNTNTDNTTSGTSTFNALTYSFNPITLAATHAATYPVAATVFINTPPAAGTNVTITSAYSLYVNSGDSYFNGNVFGTNGAMGTFTHILGNNATSNNPSISAGTGAGTSPTVSIQGTDMDGLITVTTGTTPSPSATVATITYGYAYPTHSYVVLYPTNAITAALGVNMVYTTGGTTNFTLTSSATGLTAATTYQWSYHVGGY